MVPHVVCHMAPRVARDGVNSIEFYRNVNQTRRATCGAMWHHMWHTCGTRVSVVCFFNRVTVCVVYLRPAAPGRVEGWPPRFILLPDVWAGVPGGWFLAT